MCCLHCWFRKVVRKRDNSRRGVERFASGEALSKSPTHLHRRNKESSKLPGDSSVPIQTIVRAANLYTSPIKATWTFFSGILDWSIQIASIQSTRSRSEYRK